jgi:hypothetical protein
MSKPEPGWFRQDGETNKSYAAFQHYLHLASSERTVERAYLETGLKQVLNRSQKSFPTIWGEWCRLFDWVARAAAYDDHLAARSFLEREIAVTQEAQTWAKRRDQQREREWEGREKLLERVDQMLKLPIVERTVEQSVMVNDQEIPTLTVIKPVGWNQRDIGRTLEIASKLGRLACDLETDRSVITHEVNATVESMLLSLEGALMEEGLDLEVYHRALERVLKRGKR